MPTTSNQNGDNQSGQGNSSSTATLVPVTQDDSDIKRTPPSVYPVHGEVLRPPAHPEEMTV